METGGGILNFSLGVEVRGGGGRKSVARPTMLPSSKMFTAMLHSESKATA